MKRIVSVLVLATIFAFGLFAQNDNRKLEFNEDVDFSIGGDVFSAEPLSYFAFGDHSFLNVDEDFNQNKGKANSEFVMNLLELRVSPYPTGRFTLGLDFDWDYYRLDSYHYWLPEADKVSIKSMENSGLKKIKKSRLSVRTLSVPVAFEQDFGQFTLRLGASAEYNFPGIVRFKGVDREGGTVKHWKSGNYFSKDVKTTTFTYNVFGAISFGGIGAYVKYCPVQQFEKGYGPQFQTLTFGVITGLGM